MNNLFKIAVFIFDSHAPKILVNFRVKVFRFIRNLTCPQKIRSEHIINFREDNKHVFFGYYDVTPFDKEDGKLLAMRAPLIVGAPKMGDEAEVGYYDLKELQKGFMAVGKTNTWCWQQGCRLQWYAGKENQILYNCLVEDKYGAVIKEIPSGKTIKTINKPLYSISSDGKWGLSLDFSRLQRLRPGYGYGVLEDKTADEPMPGYNGIELVNLETNESHQIFSVKKISEIERHESMDGAQHYFNHLMFNPSGCKFLFYHLWTKEAKKYSRIFVADRNGGNIKLLNNSGKSSHYNWISDDKIILYSYTEKIKNYSFAVFDLDGRVEYFGKNSPEGDGHPTFFASNLNLLVDTYPDLCHQRNLLCYHANNDQLETIAKFDDFDDFAKEFRCDLHPRVNNGKNKICVDRIRDRRRIISILEYNFNK